MPLVSTYCTECERKAEVIAALKADLADAREEADRLRAAWEGQTRRADALLARAEEAERVSAIRADLLAYRGIADRPAVWPWMALFLAGIMIGLAGVSALVKAVLG